MFLFRSIYKNCYLISIPHELLPHHQNAALLFPFLSLFSTISISPDVAFWNNKNGNRVNWKHLNWLHIASFRVFGLARCASPSDLTCWPFIWPPSKAANTERGKQVQMLIIGGLEHLGFSASQHHVAPQTSVQFSELILPVWTFCIICLSTQELHCLHPGNWSVQCVCLFPHRRNKHGCEMCRCVKCPPFTCDKHCSDGYRQNRKGCSICMCKGKPHLFWKVRGTTEEDTTFDIWPFAVFAKTFLSSVLETVSFATFYLACLCCQLI